MLSLQGLFVGVTLCPRLPWTALVYGCCPGIIINGALFISEVRSVLVWELNYMSITNTVYYWDTGSLLRKELWRSLNRKEHEQKCYYSWESWIQATWLTIEPESRRQSRRHFGATISYTPPVWWTDTPLQRPSWIPECEERGLDTRLFVKVSPISRS